jgi:hypothetical protein
MKPVLIPRQEVNRAGTSKIRPCGHSSSHIRHFQVRTFKAKKKRLCGLRVSFVSRNGQGVATATTETEAGSYRFENVQ